MAEIGFTVVAPPEGFQLPAGVYCVQWALANTDTMKPYCAPQYPGKSLQVTGTFGGGTLTIKGSNEVAMAPDGALFMGLRDPSHTALTFAAAGLKQILEDTLWVGGGVTGGDGSTALVVRGFFTTVARR